MIFNESHVHLYCEVKTQAIEFISCKNIKIVLKESFLDGLGIFVAFLKTRKNGHFSGTGILNFARLESSGIVNFTREGGLFSQRFDNLKEY